MIFILGTNQNDLINLNICEDVVGIIKDVDPIVDYINDNNEAKKQKKFSITDGRYVYPNFGHIFITLSMPY